jgi:regulator of sigma E protease
LGMHLIASNWLIWLLTPANWPVVLAVAGGLGFVIFVHELGHFLVAKACGVKCEKFYLGFDIGGISIVKFQWGETEYGIGILPLGGYVKMLGQDDNPANMAEETRRSQTKSDPSRLAVSEHAPPLTHGDLPPEPVSDPHTPYDPRSYMAQSVPKRMAIISAGVIMNVIFAFIMATVAYALGVPETPCVVGGTVVGGAAWQANFQPGDRIAKIADVENPRFRDLQVGVTLGDIQQGIPFTVDRAADNKPEDVVLHPDSSQGIPMIGITNAAEAKLIDRPGHQPTTPFSTARQATQAFEPGDKIVKINDMPVDSNRDLNKALAKYTDEPIQVTVERTAGADRADQKAPAAEAKQVTITVEPSPMRDFGMIMPLGPIKAVQKDSPAEKAGLKAGDKIVAVDGKPVGNPMTLENRLLQFASSGKSVALEIERTGEAADNATKRLTINITPRVSEFTDIIYTFSPLPLASLGLVCQVPTTVASVEPGSPAANAGIQPGDEIVTEKLINPPQPKAGEPGADAPDESPPSKTVAFGKSLSWPGYVLSFLPTIDPDTKFQFEIKRGDKEESVELSLAELKNEAGLVLHSPDRGFNYQPTTLEHRATSLGEAIRLGRAETIDSLLLVYRFLHKLGSGQVPVSGLGGPMTIAEQAGLAAQQGLSSLLLFLTMLSANLAVINFLPIPVLDGGHMVFLLYEGLRGKPASERIIVGFTYLGLVFLLLLMVFVFAMDINRIFHL